ncbi:MAG: acyltransferase [Actinobacteria bacterium]|nr:acyltransferase [Actinomycetota bacterium]
MNRLPYLPGLDGLRAIAVVAVMIYHANHDWLQGGYLGVEVFFVISGYLITLLLIGEHERSGTLRLGQFWKRRFRRLLPALYVLLIGVAVYVTAFYISRREEIRGDLAAAVTYVSNWYQIIVGQGYGAGEKFVPLRHLWSLAVEEQFYLLWPLVMLLLLRRSRGRLPAIGVRLIVASVVVAAVVAYVYVPGATAGTCEVEGFRNGWATVAGKCINVNETLYLGSFSRAGGLLLGGGFAMLWRPAAVVRGPLRNMGGRFDVLAGFGLALLVYLFFTMWLFDRQIYNPWLFRGGFLLTGVATLMLIAAATHQHSTTGKLLGNRLFLWIGTRSYGLYLFHWPIYQVIRKQANIQLTVLELVTALMLTIPITEFSYRFVEVPIRTGGLGRAAAIVRRDPRKIVAAVSVVGLVAVATMSLYKAEAQCVGDVQQSLCESAAAAATVPTIESTSSATDATTSVSDSSAPTIPTTTAVPADPYPYVAIGESVMAGADDELKAAGMWVDVKESRTPEGVRTIIIGLRRGGIIGDGTDVIIQVGTNNPMDAEAIAAIMVELPETVGRVLFLTLRAPPAWIPANNELIRSLPSTYPNVTVVDWELRSSEVELCPDGIHLTCGGRAAAIFYTNLILAELGIPAIS